MGRLVEAPRYERLSSGKGGGLEGLGGADGPKVPVGGDDFLARIAKYVPGEVLAGYMAIDRSLFDYDAPKGKNLLATSNLEGKIQPRWDISDDHLVLIVFAICVIATPIYIWFSARQAGPRPRWMMHAFVATCGFVVWAYAIKGGVFMGHGLYNSKLAAILVLAFTLLSGLMTPRAQHSDGDGDGDADRSPAPAPRRGGVAT